MKPMYARRFLVTVIVLTGTIGAQGREMQRRQNWNVQDYGARGMKEEVATKSMQAAIDACHQAGGGTVVVPPGFYTSGALQLKDNVTLQLEAGATLIPSQSAKDYPKGVRALLYSDGAKRIALTGRGVVDGQARYKWGEVSGPDGESIDAFEIARKAGLDMRRSIHDGLRIHLVHFRNSTDVFVNDLTLKNSQIWTLRLDNCERVRIRGVYLYSDLEKAVNADGIDVTSSRDVVISDSMIVTADDAICLKTSREGGPTENVTVTNCVLSSSSAAMKIGSESFADIRHVVFSNCIVRNSNRGFGIQLLDGGTVSDVLVTNITMELNRRHWNWWGNAEPIYILLKRRTPQSQLGTIRDVVIQNVMARARGTSRILGSPERNIEKITLRNIDIDMQIEDAIDKRATDALLVQGVDELLIRDLSIRWAEDQLGPKWARALSFKKVGWLEMNGFSGRQGLRGSESPAVALEDVAEGWVRNCRALSGTGIFFDVRGPSTRRLRFTENDLAAAPQPFLLDDAVRKAVGIGQTGEN